MVDGGYFLIVGLSPHASTPYKWEEKIQIPVSLKDLAKQAYKILSSLSAKLIQHLDYFIVLRSKFQSLQLKKKSITFIVSITFLKNTRLKPFFLKSKKRNSTLFQTN